MLSIDPLASYVVCGAGSFVAAAMTLLVRPDEARLRQALHIATLGFVLLGAGLFQLLFTGPMPGEASIWFALWLSAMCGPVFALALARLAGQALIQRPFTIAVMILGTALMAVAGLAGGLAPGRAFTVLATLGAALCLLACWPFLARPRHDVERVLGVVVLGYTFSWLLRSGFTLSFEGPRLVHELYVPTTLLPWFAIGYSCLPIVLASLLLNTASIRLQQQLKSRASTDELTGVLMRRALRELAPAAVARAQAAGREAALLMVDLDRFKAINDQHGHLAGDAVLHHVAQVLLTQLRPDSLVGRFGGEEFMVLVEVNHTADARSVAERLRLAVANSPCRLPGDQTITITISIGVAICGPGEGVDTALMRADEALYRAKRGGRDRVEIGLMSAR